MERWGCHARNGDNSTELLLLAVAVVGIICDEVLDSVMVLT